MHWHKWAYRLRRILPSEIPELRGALEQMLLSEDHASRTEFANVRYDFVIVELELGLTFASLAKGNPRNIERAKRNIKNARKAFDVSQYYSSQLDGDLGPKFKRLTAEMRANLLDLGELV